MIALFFEPDFNDFTPTSRHEMDFPRMRFLHDGCSRLRMISSDFNSDFNDTQCRETRRLGLSSLFELAWINLIYKTRMAHGFISTGGRTRENR